MYCTSFGISVTFHDHKVRGIVLKEELGVFEDIGFPPACWIEPRLRIEGIPIPRIAVFIDSRGKAAILLRSQLRKSGKDHSVLISTFHKLDLD